MMVATLLLATEARYFTPQVVPPERIGPNDMGVCHCANAAEARRVGWLLGDRSLLWVW